MPLDDLDLKLLKLLKENARTPYSKLAKELGISESAVRKRISRLIKSGIIKKITIEYELINEIKAIILVKTQPPVPVPEVSKNILKIPGVEIVYELTGEYDILVIVRASGIEMINKFIDEIRSIPGVTSTYTMVVLRTWI
ncbi:HTH-type transcriptional regulator LysM [Ignisphaera sp. 4213-co]|uniref:HTH-type transcriptional regulator LysM n=1 Tax=Ignisphaera cupida TaxID=3050454 RepID=A0ABD4ZAL9_9CREN|nr:HTH-type transcriptional regulator LysM [Ignisphaera sp. 4213-co]MDK6029138.1 HTH-type transcriptional regulator LysM [Ignisphaera sp. 4213-co]